MGNNRSLLITASLDNLGQIRDFVNEAMTDFGATASCAADMQLAVDEAVTNIVVHGYQDGGDVEVEVQSNDGVMLVHVRDHAPQFAPTNESGADLSIGPLEQPAAGGFGLHLIRGMVDSAEYGVTADGRNELTLIKRCPVEQE